VGYGADASPLGAAPATAAPATDASTRGSLESRLAFLKAEVERTEALLALGEEPKAEAEAR